MYQPETKASSQAFFGIRTVGQLSSISPHCPALLYFVYFLRKRAGTRLQNPPNPEEKTGKAVGRRKLVYHKRALVSFAGIDGRSYTGRHQSSPAISVPALVHHCLQSSAPAGLNQIARQILCWPSLLAFALNLPISTVDINEVFLWRTACPTYFSLLLSIALARSLLVFSSDNMLSFIHSLVRLSVQLTLRKRL